MPIYEYECTKCGKHHEIMQNITAAPLSLCPACGGALKKMISNTSFVLKGSGWYATDYASDKKKGADKKAEDSKETGTKTEPKAETKSETKTETKTETKKAAASK